MTQLRQTVNRVLQSEFTRNVAVVVLGTAGAQGITVAFSPVLTRIYGPEAFGILSTFTALVGVITPLATFSYPMAIVLPGDDADAINIACLSLMIAAVMGTITAMILYLFTDFIAQAANLQAISSCIILLPLVMFFSACLQVATYWVIRNNLFQVKAKVAIAQALILNVAKIAFGVINPVAIVLIAISTIGSALYALMLYLGMRRAGQVLPQVLIKLSRLVAVAKRHCDFAVYRTPQNVIYAVSQGLPIIVLATVSGPAAAGFYSVARTVLALPITLVAKSAGEVFYPKVARVIGDGRRSDPLIVKGTLGLAAIGLLPFGFVVLVGPGLFGFVFGADWTTAGEYARWLAVMLFFHFINSPSVAAVPVLGLQRGLVVYEVLGTGTKIMALYLGFRIFDSDHVAVALFALVGSLAYILLISWVVFEARGYDRPAQPLPQEIRT